MVIYLFYEWDNNIFCRDFGDTRHFLTFPLIYSTSMTVFPGACNLKYTSFFPSGQAGKMNILLSKVCSGISCNPIIPEPPQSCSGAQS